MDRATRQAGMVLPDGAGIIMAANILGYTHSGRATGPALMLKLCDWGRQKGYRHFFYGGTEGIADKLAQRLTEMYPGLEVAGTCCPPFRQLCEAEDQEIVDTINDARPDIIWVGLGAPKQEKWMADHVGRLKATAMVGVGAAFDFHSGNVKWAPAIIRRLGLEWAWRLAENPKRMWRRNLDSPLFLTKVFIQMFKSKFVARPAPEVLPEDTVSPKPEPIPDKRSDQPSVVSHRKETVTPQPQSRIMEIEPAKLASKVKSGK